MSNRAKLLISILFIAAIILTIGLTRFYFDVTKNNVKIDTDQKIESIIKSYENKHVFRTENGYCGVVNENGAVIIEPEWMEVLDVTDDLVLVSRRIGDTVLIGGLDYEENIVLPLVYSEFKELGEDYLAGIVAEDGSCLIYRRDYTLALPSAYEEASYENGDLELSSQGCTYVYHPENDKLQLQAAQMQCAVGGKMLNWRVSNQVYLTELDEHDLQRISRCITVYTDMLIQDDFSDLSSITSSDFFSALSKPGSMPDAKIDALGGFSLSKQESATYDLAFTATYHTGGSPEHAQSVQMHLFLRRNAENQMILTSANLNFRSASKPAAGTDDDAE